MEILVLSIYYYLNFAFCLNLATRPNDLSFPGWLILLCNTGFSKLRYILLKWIALYKRNRFLEVSFVLLEFQQLHILRIHLKAVRIFTNLMFYLMVLFSKKVGWRKKDLTIFSNRFSNCIFKPPRNEGYGGVYVKRYGEVEEDKYWRPAFQWPHHYFFLFNTTFIFREEIRF